MKKSRLFSQLFLLGLVLVGLFSSCYSFSGVSVDYAVMKTYYVANFQDNSINSPPILPQTLAEALREKIRRESRLVQSEVDPDIEFVGTLVDFRITAEAPQGGDARESTAVNRLTIVTAIEYINHKQEDKSWKNNFSFFYDYPSTQDLSAVQDEAIEVISNQIMEDIFNKAFTDW